MTQTVELPIWLFVLIVVFAAVTFASHFLFPSVRWFFRLRFERAVKRLNRRLERPIEPFKLARRYDMIQRLIYDPQVTQGVAEQAAIDGVPENVAFEQAKRFAREIVPSFSAFTYFGFATKAANLLSNATYRVRLGYQDEAALSAIPQEATVIYVMNHRSNMDYVLVTYLAARRSALSYAVGEWARVWPISRLIRAMGAYFIRRRSRSELYRKVLAAYIRMATKGGGTQAIFPEGGLSLDGHLAPPKLGLLKYILSASEAEGKDVVFVPVALNYDRVLEDRILTSAAKAGERRFKARIHIIMLRMIRQFYLWLTFRYHRFGYAAVSFGRPVALSELGVSGVEDEDGRTRALARGLMRRIGDVVPVLPVPAVSWVLCNQGALSRAELEEAVAQLAAQIPDAAIHLPEGEYSHAVEYGLRQLLRRRMVREEADKIYPNPDKQELLRYYARSLAHLLPGLPVEGEAVCATEDTASAK